MGELKAYKEDIYCVGECWSADGETLEYVSSLNCFNFQIAQGEGFIANAAKEKNIETFTKYVEKYQAQVKAENPTDGMMIPFIANHDMDRAAGYLTMSDGKAKVGASLLLLSPGSPFIYYGEEIALKGTRGGANTDANRRLAMLWGDEDTIKDPVGSTYDSKKQTNGTVAEQLEAEDSLLHHYRKLITIRKEYPEIARGAYKSLNIGKQQIGGFVVTYEEKQTFILHNTSTEEIQIDLGLYEEFSAGGYKVVEYVGAGEAKLNGTTLTVGPQTSVILK
jgi:glycosidase